MPCTCPDHYFAKNGTRMDHMKLAETAIKSINGATIPATEAENVAATKAWLMAIYEGRLAVVEKEGDAAEETASP